MSKDVKMSDDFEFLSLDEDEREWADQVINIYENLKIKRENRKNYIKERGFDISAEAKKLENKF